MKSPILTSVVVGADDEEETIGYLNRDPLVFKPNFSAYAIYVDQRVDIFCSPICIASYVPPSFSNVTLLSVPIKLP